MINEINYLTFGAAVSSKNVNQRNFFSTPTLLVWPRRWPFAKKWHHV